MARKADYKLRIMAVNAKLTTPLSSDGEGSVVREIEQALADVKAGRLTPHDEAMARLEVTITSSAAINSKS